MEPVIFIIGIVVGLACLFLWLFATLPRALCKWVSVISFTLAAVTMILVYWIIVTFTWPWKRLPYFPKSNQLELDTTS